MLNGKLHFLCIEQVLLFARYQTIREVLSPCRASFAPPQCFITKPVIQWVFHPMLFIASIFRSSHPEVFLGKGVLKICSKFTGEHPCGSAISIKLLSNFIETALWHWCFPVISPHIFRTPFSQNTSEWLPMYFLLKFSFFLVLFRHIVASSQRFMGSLLGNIF